MKAWTCCALLLLISSAWAADSCPGTLIDQLPFVFEAPIEQYTPNYWHPYVFGGPDAVFRFAPPQPGLYYCSICGSDFRAFLDVRPLGVDDEPICPPDSLLDSTMRDTCPFMSGIALASSGGNELFFLFVYGEPEAQGIFRLTVDRVGGDTFPIDVVARPAVENPGGIALAWTPVRLHTGPGQLRYRINFYTGPPGVGPPEFFDYVSTNFRVFPNIAEVYPNGYFLVFAEWTESE